LAKAKTYAFASADYPGQSTSIVTDESASTILGVFQASNAQGFTLKATSINSWSCPVGQPMSRSG
jgi:hypothetical protein